MGRKRGRGTEREDEEEMSAKCLHLSLGGEATLVTLLPRKATHHSLVGTWRRSHTRVQPDQIATTATCAATNCPGEISERVDAEAAASRPAEKQTAIARRARSGCCANVWLWCLSLALSECFSHRLASSHTSTLENVSISIPLREEWVSVNCDLQHDHSVTV